MTEIKINKINYTLSPFDTESTIINKIANDNDTLPEYIHLENFYAGKKIKAIFLKDLLNVSLTDLNKTIQNLKTDWKKIPAREMALYYIKIKKINIDDELVPIYAAINKTDFYNINGIKSLYDEYKKIFIEQFNQLTLNLATEEKMKEELIQYKPVETTEFIQDSIVLDYELETDMDPIELFDNFKTSKNIPFISLTLTPEGLATGASYYKFFSSGLPNGIPPDEWLDPSSSSGLGVFNLYLASSEASTDSENFGAVSINVLGDNKMILRIEISVEEKTSEISEKEQQVVKMIIDAFGAEGIKIKNRKENGIKGVFAVPNFNLVKEVFLEFLTNDDIISHYLYVDEVRYLSTEKSVLYVYYSPMGGAAEAAEEPLTCFLSQKVATRSDIFFKNKVLTLFVSYLNVRISRALTLSQIERFQQAFSTILSVYKDKFAGIVKEYASLIPGFKYTLEEEESLTGDSNLKKLQIKNPELFIYGYPTKCEKTHQPIPIEKEEIKEWKKTRDIIQYPLDSEDYYICPDENFKYPGLKVNKLENNDKYKYLLCCYLNDSGKPYKTWTKYKEGIDLEVEKSKVFNIVHLKIVTDGKLGYLPRNIYYLLKQYVSSQGQEYQFYRKGVIHNNSSFLHAVALALDPNYEKIEDKGEYIADIRRNLLTGSGEEPASSLANVIQEMYYLGSKGESSLEDDLLNDNVILDSQKFIGLVEAYYDCKIIVFIRNDEYPNGDFEIPFYSQGYLFEKFNPNKKTVLIYKHRGQRSDHLLPTDYHYELLIGTPPIEPGAEGINNKKIISYLVSNPLINILGNYFNKKYQLYLIGLGLGSPQSIPLLEKLKFTSQTIDIYGKCRGLINDDIYIITSPINPLKNVNITSDPPKNLSTLKKVVTWLNKNKLEILKQDVLEDKVIGLLIKFPGISYSYIPVKSSPPLDGIEGSSNLGFYAPPEGEGGEDIMESTLVNKKIADFMMQLALYSYSFYYKKHFKKESMENLALELLENQKQVYMLAEEFCDNKIIIDEKHDFKKTLKILPRKLTFNSNFFSGEKLIVDSKNSFDRLKYYIKYMAGFNLDLVINYKDRVFLDNYYTQSLDFVQNIGETIFIGALSLLNWIKSQKALISLGSGVTKTSLVPLNTEDPYFFVNWKLNDGLPMLIQNVEGGSLSRALQVCENYTTKGINTGFNTPEIKDQVGYKMYYFREGIMYVSTVGIAIFNEILAFDLGEGIHYSAIIDSFN